jgi:hypothetical protein
MEHKTEYGIEYETCMRDNGKVTLHGDQVNIEYGKISFVRGGKEYDLNRVMKRKAPDQIFSDYGYQIVLKGVVINGVTLLYPNDFLQSDEIDWDETVAYRIMQKEEAKQHRNALVRALRQRQRHAKEAELQREKHAKEAELQRDKHEKQNSCGKNMQKKQNCNVKNMQKR